MDAFLAITSKRDERRYADRPVPADVADRILDAGRLAGSARNKQPWLFLVLETREIVERMADTVYVPDNVRTAGLVVVIVSPEGGGTFDAGRAAQNMMLAAWNEGIASCPNGMPDSSATAAALGLDGREEPLIVLSFGYPARERDPEGRGAEEWSRRANRKPLDQVARRI